ncbi:MAG: hypothetical protein IJ880_14465 [Bacilli bacterium]|nr:hypothetical protein [Bacilli bacterium]
MASNELSTKEKERLKLQFCDLSPSLQDILNNKLNKSELDKFSKELDDFKKFMNGMKLTIGSSYPTNPINNKNLHLNLTDRVLYVYTNRSWRPVCMIPKN